MSKMKKLKGALDAKENGIRYEQEHERDMGAMSKSDGFRDAIKGMKKTIETIEDEDKCKKME